MPPCFSACCIISFIIISSIPRDTIITETAYTAVAKAIMPYISGPKYLATAMPTISEAVREKI